MSDSESQISDLKLPSSTAAPVKQLRGRGKKRAILLLLVMVALTALVSFSPVGTWIKDTNFNQAVRLMGWWVYPIGTAVLALLVACGVPRLALCVLAGTLLGFWGGLIVSESSTILGYYAAFLFVRWGGSEWVMHRWPKLQKWSELVGSQGPVGVILLRQLPIHGSLINLGLGLSRIKHRYFLIGTAIGVIPESVPSTLIGAGLVKGSPKLITFYLVGAVILFAIIWIICGLAIRRMRKSRSGASLLANEASLKGVGEE